MRRGFLLYMWTGVFENPRTEKPIVFKDVAGARRYLNKFPSWGRSAVECWSCKVRPKGKNGKVDYIIETRVF